MLIISRICDTHPPQLLCLAFYLTSLINLNLFLLHPPFLSTLAPSLAPVFLSPAAAVDVLKHEVIFSVVRLAATCIICLGFLLLLLPEEWDSVTLRFLANIADKKSEDHGEELTESSINTRSRSRANGAVSIPLAWHGKALLEASANQSWSPVCSCIHCPPERCSEMFGPHGLYQEGIKLELHLDLHHFTAGGETGKIYGSCKLKGCYLFSWNICHAQSRSSHAPKPRAVCPPLTCSADCILWI